MRDNESTASLNVPLLARRTSQQHSANKNPRELASKLVDISRRSLIASTAFQGKGRENINRGVGRQAQGARQQNHDLTKKIEDMRQYVNSFNEGSQLSPALYPANGTQRIKTNRHLLSSLLPSATASRITQLSNTRNNLIVPTYDQPMPSKTGWRLKIGHDDINEKISTLKDFVGGSGIVCPDDRNLSTASGADQVNVPLLPPVFHPPEEHLLVPPGRQYAKDYASLAKEYKKMEQYRCHNPLQQIPCIICKSLATKSKVKIKTSSKWSSATREKTHERHTTTHNRTLSKVFFPCEHLCVCDTCYRHQFRWTECPLCHQEIKVVFDHNGREQDDYWDWVNEIKPPLPKGFEKAFAIKSQYSIAKAMNRSIEGFEGTGDGSSKDGVHDQKELPDMYTYDESVRSQACLIS